MTSERRAATEAEARALASAVRLRILRLCLDRALTNKELAERLGVNPATVLHHVRTLVTTGFLAPQAERRGARGAREVPYLATGKSWRLDIGDSSAARGGQAMLDAFLDEIRHVELDGAGGVGLARLGLRLAPADRDELVARITELLTEYRERAPDLENGSPVSVFVAVYPDVTRP
jgi:predicted ArsR family transcriptional regulator